MSWKKLKSQQIYKNKFITVFHENVSAPTGFLTEYGRVHFHKKAVSVCVVNKKTNEILLVGQDRYPLSAFSWETIQGGGELYEDPLKIARREMREEGKIDSENLNFICKTNTSNSVTDEEAFVYWCDFSNTRESNKDFEDPTELIVRKWFELQTVLEMIHKQEITDSLTQISIFSILNILKLNL